MSKIHSNYDLWHQRFGHKDEDGCKVLEKWVNKLQKIQDFCKNWIKNTHHFLIKVVYVLSTCQA